MDENKQTDLEPQVKPKRRKFVWYITIAISSTVLIAAIVTLCIKFFGGKVDYSEYKSDINSNVSTVLPQNPIDFDALWAENPDVCAWIQVDGTVIDYPILQSDIEKDDNFYLDHDMNGASKSAGAIYIQKLNQKDFTDPNTLIYGHNMLNGTMFGQLKKFRNKDFFNENRNIYIYTPEHILKYEIISAFVYDNRHIINSFNFDVESSKMQFFNECVNPTSLTKQVVENASLEADDNIITLSTCTSNSSERYLVVGKLISDTKTAK